MKPEHKFHAYVTTTTVGIMYFVIQHVLPLISITGNYDLYLKPIITVLVAAGTYKTLASILLSSVSRVRLLKKFLLGPEYVNGTWIGRFMTSENVPVYTIEHFEQTLSSLKIRGQAYLASGENYAMWNSIAEAIDAPAGTLTYTYGCDMNANSSSFQGIAVFQFGRADSKSAPQSLVGYSADMIDGKRSHNAMIKWDDELRDHPKALEKAKKAFKIRLSGR